MTVMCGAWYEKDGYDMAAAESPDPQKQERTRATVTLRKEKRGITQITLALVWAAEEDCWLVTYVEAKPLVPAEAGQGFRVAYEWRMRL